MSFLNFHANFCSKNNHNKERIRRKFGKQREILGYFLRWEANYKPEILAGGFRSISFTTVGL